MIEIRFFTAGGSIQRGRLVKLNRQQEAIESPLKGVLVFMGYALNDAQKGQTVSIQILPDLSDQSDTTPLLEDEDYQE